MAINVTQTAVQTGDAQSLSRVQREAVMTVLDVRLAGHWVKVALQRKLLVESTGLDLLKK